MIEQQIEQPAVLAAPAPPRVPGWPLVGVLPAFVRRPTDFLVAARARYGDIYAMNLGPFRFVVLNHPRLVEHVFRDNSRNYLRSGPLYESLGAFLGNGLAVSEGAFWLRQRRMMQPHFHRKRLAMLTDLMAETIADELASWAPAAQSGMPFDVLPALSRITMKVLVRTIFGTALSTAEADALAVEIAYAIDHIFLDTLAGALPRWLPVPGVRRYRRVRAVVDAALYDVIARARRGEGSAGTLLAMLLDLVDAETGAQMTDQQLRDEIITLVLAGYETTSLAIAWTCQLLTDHPDVLAKLVVEVDRLEGRRPSVADLPALPYTSMVIQESMRLRPPAWVVTRRAEADDVVDGFTIPAGTLVAMAQYAIHRHPELWEDPERFDPERFTPERVAARHKSAWLAFGLGQHQCIGKDFALMEAQLILALLVQRYLVASAPGRPPSPQLSGTLRPKGGVRIKLTQRG